MEKDNLSISVTDRNISARASQFQIEAEELE